jgi:glucan 1,3-beta-glucosidase
MRSACALDPVLIESLCRPDAPASYANDTAAIAQNAPKYKDQVYAITVGSETLYRRTFTGDTLMAKINDVKKQIPGFKVGTADSWNKYADGTADAIIKGGVDLL